MIGASLMACIVDSSWHRHAKSWQRWKHTCLHAVSITQPGSTALDSGEHGTHASRSGEHANYPRNRHSDKSNLKGYEQVKVCNRSFVSVHYPSGETHGALPEDADECKWKRAASDRDLNLGIRRIGMKLEEDLISHQQTLTN